MRDEELQFLRVKDEERCMMPSVLCEVCFLRNCNGCPCEKNDYKNKRTKTIGSHGGNYLTFADAVADASLVGTGDLDLVQLVDIEEIQQVDIF